MGATCLFPIVGRLEGFEWEGSFYSQPVMRESIAVVHGSVRINQGLDDAVFKLTPPGRPAAPEVARRERDGANLALPGQFAKADPEPYPRTDPASVSARLQAQLVAADQQSKALEAPSIARGSEWSWVVLTQAILAVCGLLLLALGGWRWRSR